jgi:hypothetical protein
MYENLPNNSTLYNYLINNCKWLLEPLKINTNVKCNHEDKIIYSDFPSVAIKDNLLNTSSK